ncbi:MAG TPA: class I SAM-dependent methyltransferase, partial [Halococcus sp.]|nr:class I SAM-dependent methyltransferase [Halococcus sp.]
MTEADPLGRAMCDYQCGGLRGECIHRDGTTVWDADIYENYFLPSENWHETTPELLDSLAGPVLNVGCGPGQHALWLQEHGREVVGIDRSPGAIEAATKRGVNDARVMDMFELDFPRDRFRSALVVGTQIGLAGSLAGVAAFCRDLAYVTDEQGVAVIHNYD